MTIMLRLMVVLSVIVACEAGYLVGQMLQPHA